MSQEQKILVVDDERFNINVLVDLLKPNYKMMAAKNGEQALKAARSDNPPDLILLDVMMLDMDGYEVCEQLKSGKETRDIPVIFVTALGQEADEKKGFSVGAIDYITKPISHSIVEARVKTQLTLKKSMGDLQKAYAVIESQKDRMQTELNVGRDIQLAMVPKEFPESTNYSIHAILEPAREVGGDFYDVFNIDQDHVCFCVGDVSGKGVPAALFMAMAKTLIKSRASSDSSTASIVTHVNDELSKDNEGCLFVTLFVCMLNVRTGELTTTNAGHNPPYLKHADGSISILRHRDGPVVAAIEGTTYSEQRIQLKKGDTLFLFTDGVTEADDLNGVLFGDDRLEKLLYDWKGDSMQDLTMHVVTETHNYEGENRQADDITVLALNYNEKSSVHASGFEIEINNDLANIDLVNDQFMVFAQSNELPKKTSAAIRMAFDELLANVISYAYTDEEQHTIGVKVSLMNDAVLIVIDDDGVPFNPFQLASPDTDASIEDRDIGGLGIHLVREMLDQVNYRRNVDQNVVTLIKGIDPEF